MIPLRFPSLQQGENETFFPPFSSLFNRTKFMDGSFRALENSECAWSTMGTDPGFKKKNVRKIYLKQLQINLRKHHLVYNQGCGEEKNLHAEKSTPWKQECQDGKECPFLRLGTQNIFLSRDHLNFKSRSKECQSVWSSSGGWLCFHSLHREGERQPIVCVRQEKRERKKKIPLVFKLSKDTDNSGRMKTQRWRKMIWEFIVGIKKSRKWEKSRNVRISSTKKDGLHSLCARKKMLSFASFCYFFSTLIPARTFLQYGNYLHLPFPRNPSSPFRASVFSAPPFWLFKLILIKLA